MQVKLVNQNRQITLVTSPLGSGGEGAVYEIQGEPRIVAKIYHKPDPLKMQKIGLMFKMSPYPPGQPLPAHVALAWPLDVIENQAGQAAGFIMPRMRAGMKTVYEAFQPLDRRKLFSHFTWAHLHRVAYNIATTMHLVHQVGKIALGDVNESNIMVAPDSMITIIDCDSFQVGPYSASGPGGSPVNFRCPVGKPEYTPPELQGVAFANVDRTPEHDRFGLGVLVWQLLMEGTHSFDGIYTGQMDPPPLREDAIREGYFIHGGGTGPYKPKPTAVPFRVLHPEIQRLFVRCFRDGHANPNLRPTAEEWAVALETVELTLVSCSANSQHKYAPQVANCPWCERLNKFKIDSFPRRALTTRPMPVTTPGPAAPPPAIPITPAVTPTAPTPTPLIVLPQTAGNLGRVRVGRSALPWIFEVQNNGTAEDLVISSVAAVPSRPFYVQSLTATVVPVGGSRQVVINFHPTARGNFNAAVEIRSNDPASPIAVIALYGVGIGPVVQLSWPNQPGAMDFGEVLAGQPAPPQKIRIANGGDDDLGNIIITSLAPVFTVGAYRGTLPPRDQQEVEIIFTPAGSGVITGSLRIDSDDPAQPSLFIQVSGSGKPVKICSVCGAPNPADIPFCAACGKFLHIRRKK